MRDPILYFYEDFLGGFLPSGTGTGPAVWVHSLLPDYHAFRGSYGGYAFPLWDRRNGVEANNLNPALLATLAVAYGHPVSAETIFDAMTGLLSATSYTSRFAWDLEEAFAHVPFPADAGIFLEAARIGAEIRALETFSRDPAPNYRSARLTGRATGVTLAMPPPARAFQNTSTDVGSIARQEDRSLCLTGLPERVIRGQWLPRAAALARRQTARRWMLPCNAPSSTSPGGSRNCCTGLTPLIRFSPALLPHSSAAANSV